MSSGTSLICTLGIAPLWRHYASESCAGGTERDYPVGSLNTRLFLESATWTLPTESTAMPGCFVRPVKASGVAVLEPPASQDLRPEGS